MQKARRHHTSWLRPLVGAWFQVLFHSPVRGSFHLSLTVLCAIGLSVVFSLSGWSPIIRPEFLVFRLTQVAVLQVFSSRTGLSPSPTRRSSRFRSITSWPLTAPITPARALRHRRFGLFPVRSPLLGESLLLSLPAGTKMFQFPAFASALQMKGSLPPGCPIRKSAGQCVFATRRSFSQLVTSFFASESQGIPHAPFVVPLFLYTSRLRHVVSPFGLLVCETLLCFYSCLLAISSAP